MDADAMTLTRKESEGLLWGLAQIGDYTDKPSFNERDPLYVLRAKGWSDEAIKEASGGLEELQYLNVLPDKPTPLEADILRCCVENSTWITTYRTNTPTMHSNPHIEEALAALRSLSAKLERIGVEVSHIPFN